MITVRGQQLAALDALYLAERPARHVVRLRKEFPELAADEAAFESRVSELCADARDLGFTTERNELRFVRLGLLFGEGFSDARTMNVVARVLGDVDASPSGRLDFVERHLRCPVKDWPAPKEP